MLATRVTAELTSHLTGVAADVFVLLEWGVETPVPSAPGWSVTAFDAHHCPGAALLFFCRPDGERVLHTGDCRATPSLVAGVAALVAEKGSLTALHLDTTYCHPRHAFPPAADAIEAAVAAAQAALATPGGCVAIQCYSCGKEPLLAALATLSPVGVSPRRATTLTLAAPAVRGGLDLSRFVSSDDAASYRATRIRVTKWGAFAATWPFFQPDFKAADEHLRSAGGDTLTALVPTGFAAAAAAARSGADRSRGDVRVVAVPYSEHSSFAELRALVGAARPARLVPTVGGGTAREVAAIVARFSDLLDGRAAAAALLGGSLREREAEAGGDDAPADPPPPPPADHTPPPSPVAAVAAALAIDAPEAAALLAAAGGDATRAVNDYLAGRRTSVIAPLRPASVAAPSPARKRKAAAPAAPQKPPPASTAKPLTAFFGGGPASTPPVAPKVESPPPAPPPRPPPRPPPTPAPLAPPLGPDPARLVAPLVEFDPVADARWENGASAPYAVVAAALAAVDATRSRSAIARALANAVRCVLTHAPGDVADTLHLLLGAVAPEHEGVVLGLGHAAVAAAVAGATGSSPAAVRAAAHSSGDLGDAAAELASRQSFLGRPPPPLTVVDVVSGLRRISGARGPGAARDRTRGLEALLRRARAGGAESRYLVRTALGCLRVGAGWRSVLPAFGVAVAVCGSADLPPAPSLAAAAIAATAAYACCPSIPVLVDAVAGGGEGALARLAAARVTLGVPARPMLASAVTSPAAALDRFGPRTAFIAEHKYDGVRAQAHVPARGGGSSVALFSRSGETVTPAWPDAAAAMAAALPADALPAVLDAEIVAINRNVAPDDPSRLLPFQLLSSRPRSGMTAQAADAAHPVAVFVFDALVLGGVDVTPRSLRERRAALTTALRVAPGRVELAHGDVFEPCDADDDEDRQAGLDAALAASLAAGAEGLMLKTLHPSPYLPSARSLTWLKLKADYASGGGVDVDAVVIGAWRGHGRKAGWLSPFLVAVRDTGGRLASVARVMSGFTDAFYREATERLLPTALDAPAPGVDTRETPPFYFPPTEVWTIKGAELSASPVHTAGRGRLPASVDGSRGLALRFPRFVRARDDKAPGDATHADELLAAYGGQARRLGGGDAAVFDDGLGLAWPGDSE